MLTITDEHVQFAFYISRSFSFPERRESFLDQMMKQAPGLEKAWREWGDETSRLHGPEGTPDYQAGMEQWWNHSMWILGALFAANAKQFPPIPNGSPEEIMKEWKDGRQCFDWLSGKNLSDLHEDWADIFERNADAFGFPHMGKVRIYALAEAFIRAVKQESPELTSRVKDLSGQGPLPEIDHSELISEVEDFLGKGRQTK